MHDHIRCVYTVLANSNEMHMLTVHIAFKIETVCISVVLRAGQSRVHTPCMTVNLKASLPRCTVYAYSIHVWV